MNCNYKVKITDIQTKYKFKVFCTGYDDSELKQKIDTMYEAWPKASGEGETPTLDNTANATMSIDLKGNTSQDGTPTPDDPVDVSVVSGDNIIYVNGSNFLDNSKIVKGRLDNGVIGYESGTTSLEVTENSITFTTNTNYRGVVTEFIKMQPSINFIYFGWESATTTPTISCSYYDENKNYLSGSAGYTYTNALRYSNTVANAVYVRFYISLNTAGTQTLAKPQIRFVSSETIPAYEPYQSQSYAVNLGTMELCKIGDYQDYIYKDNKKWYKKEYIRKADITSSTNITMENASANVGKRFNIYDEGGSYFSGNATQAGAISNCYKPSYSTSVANVIFSSSTYGAVSLVDAKYTSVESFKSWAIENLIIYRILSTPTTTEITDTTLISQLEALAGAESYSGQTNISQTNDDKPFILTAKALKDLSNL